MALAGATATPAHSIPFRPCYHTGMNPNPATATGFAPAEGRIYDLGYQPYAGRREGRLRAIWTLYRAGMRRAWGLGRPFRSKIVPWSLLAFALFPAIVALGFAAFGFENFSPFRYQNYYTYIARLFLLFCTAVAPELVCPDLRQRVLTLYLARGIERYDYFLGRLGAMVTSLLVMALVPQFLLYLGTGFANQDTFGYFRGNLDVVPRIIASGLLISVYFSVIGLAISAQTNRRIYASGMFIALMFVSTFVLAAVYNTLKNEPSRYLSLLSLSEAPIIGTYWIFDAAKPQGIAQLVDLPLQLWFLVSLLYAAVAVFALAWRYLRLQP